MRHCVEVSSESDEVNGTLYYARCSCGWASVRFRFGVNATRQADIHTADNS